MEVIKTMAPGAPGTKRYLSNWGDRLVAVRYRKDPANNTRLTTIEICVDQRPLGDKRKNQRSVEDLIPVPLRVDFSETDIRQLVKDNGGVWDLDQQCWYLTYGMAKLLNLTDRIIHEIA